MPKSDTGLTATISGITMDEPIIKKRVLIVEDDENSIEALEAMLEAFGFDVSTRSCPLEGIAELKVKAYDAIVLDYQMPKMTGIEFMKKNLENNNTPIIFLTGFGSRALKKETSDLGAYAYLQKPVPPEELADIVHSAIAKYQKDNHN